MVENNLNTLLRNLPVSADYRSHGIKFRKIILEKKLKEVEDTIRQLSNTRVFVALK